MSERRSEKEKGGHIIKGMLMITSTTVDDWTLTLQGTL